MSDPVISIQNLRKSFGARVVLDDVTLEVPEGQTIALLGRNGTGKTTMIRTLLGLLPADSGRLRVAGFNPGIEGVELRRRVGYLAEDQAMYPWMTAMELCRFLAPFYPAWDQSLADGYLSQFDVPKHVRIELLSKGQAVKLGLAVALAHAPQIVILDDPALGLDPVSRKEFNRDLVEHLQAEGRTVIYSSHLLDEVEAVADQVAILDRGRIVRQGPTETLREDVQRLVVPVDVVHKRAAPTGLLDARRVGGQFEIVVDDAGQFFDQLTSEGLTVTSSGMTLDDIFEAYVIGKPEKWRETAVANT
jgi:ABC-2 type transport system ATP-binding protein